MGVCFAAARRIKTELLRGPMRVTVYEGYQPSVTIGRRVPHFDIPVTRTDGTREPKAEILVTEGKAVFPEMDVMYPNPTPEGQQVRRQNMEPKNMDDEAVGVDWPIKGETTGSPLGEMIKLGMRPKAEKI